MKVDVIMAGKLNDITGKKYGKLTVTKFIEMKGTKSVWECKCDCGNTCIKRKDSLKNDSSCGCFYRAQKIELAKKLPKSKVKNIVGQKYGHLTVIKYSHNENNYSYWECKCDCGNTCIKCKNRLGKNSSCGCLRHGDSGTRFYKIYTGMKSRCNNSTDPKYGGKGIKVEWDDYMSFKNDMYDSYLEHVEKYGEKNTSIDRIDCKGNYNKDNCRWATIDIQNNNTSRTLYVEKENGILVPFKLFCDENNLDYSEMYKKYRCTFKENIIQVSEFKDKDIV